MLTSATCGSTITKQGIYLNIYGLLYMGLFSLLIQIMSSLAIYFNLVSSLVEVNWFASRPYERYIGILIKYTTLWNRKQHKMPIYLSKGLKLKI